jgi:bifunctional UDP-N-acetylglucosamine pyrophosphorylase/glucosamine-1-phosphate N-acetyltransferase
MKKSTASVIMAAGRGSRMKAFEGNKTLLPLVPEKSPYEGSHPILLHILENLPAGPKALVVHHKKEEIIEATQGLDVIYCEQPELNGTGGALLAARSFIENQNSDQLNITMGDVPFVKKKTYLNLINQLKKYSLVVLGFCPEDKKQYGVLEIEGGLVRRIIEWKYWKTYPKEKHTRLRICNSGIYAARKSDLLRYLSILESKPQIVRKEVSGQWVEFEEFFITDLIEYMSADGLAVGCVITDEATETMGVDDPFALTKAQEIYRRQNLA